jgi:hypothetical protein
MSTNHPRANRLYFILGGFFVTNALLAEFVGGKIFSVEGTLGIDPLLDWTLFGERIHGLNMTAGVLMWPLVFIFTDIVNEYFGQRGVRFLSWLTAGLIAYAFLMAYAAMGVSPADFWATDAATGLPMDVAFGKIFGQGLWIIAGSLVAFLVGQVLDAYVFHWIRRRTGPRYIWLRATGSTLVSQFVDSFVVLFIAFWVSGQWSFGLVLAVAVVNYLYKALVATVLTPLLYPLHLVIDRYLGPALTAELQGRAAHQREEEV